MSMADRVRMDAFEERLTALEISKFKERLDVLEAGIAVTKEARAAGWEPKGGKGGNSLENEVALLRARIKKIEETI